MSGCESNHFKIALNKISEVSRIQTYTFYAHKLCVHILCSHIKWMQITVRVCVKLKENLITRCGVIGRAHQKNRTSREHTHKFAVGAHSHRSAHSGAKFASVLLINAAHTYEVWLNVISHSIKWKLLKYSAQAELVVSERASEQAHTSAHLPLAKHTPGRVRAGAKLCTR